MPYGDKKDQAACAKRHYERNKDIIKKRARKFKNASRARNSKHLKQYLAVHPCVDCGEDDIRVLDFDHVRGEKDGAVTKLANSPVSVERLRAEIDKCEIRCANCHRKKHYER